jgi:tRNA-dihydrouridine synthase B
MASPFPAGSLFMAPMVGLSHRPLRTLVREFGGLDFAYTEMASAAALVSGSKNEGWYLDAEPAPDRTMLQFFTVKVERLVEALDRCKDMRVRGADINFGCAAPHIERAGGGAAWMEAPEKAAALVAAARAVWPKLLSAKLRIGIDEDYGRLRDFCLGLAGAGLDFLCLHPRLKGEKLRRLSRWDYVRRLALDLPLPVIGNGDVRSWSGYRERVEESRPAGIMIGREAARRPWIFALIRGRERDPEFSLEVDMRACAERFFDLVEKHLPPEIHLTRARRFLFYFAENFSFAHHIRWRLQNAADLGAMRLALRGYLDEVPGDRIKIERD